MQIQTIQVGDATFQLEIADGLLRSLGSVEVAGTPLRNPANRFLPWFDSYAEVGRELRKRKSLRDACKRTASVRLFCESLRAEGA